MYQEEENGPIALRSMKPLPLNQLSKIQTVLPPIPTQVLWPIVRADSKDDKAWLEGADIDAAEEEADELNTSGSPSAEAAGAVEKGEEAAMDTGKTFTHFLEVRRPEMQKSEHKVWAKASAAYVATKTCLVQLLGMDLESSTWAKEAAKFLKGNTMKLNRSRNELIKAPFKKYVDEMDAIVKANQSGLAFVREAQARVRETYTSLQRLVAIRGALSSPNFAAKLCMVLACMCVCVCQAPGGSLARSPRSPCFHELQTTHDFSSCVA